MTPRRLRQVATGILAGLTGVVAAALLGWLPIGPGPPPDPHELATPFPAPTLQLTDHTGAARSLEPVRGVAVVFFGFTHCPDVCPLTLARLSAAVESMGRRASEVEVLFVTVDPARDTPEVLARYLEAFGPQFTGLTGTEEEIAAASEAWGIYRDVHMGQDQDHAAQGTVDHTARSFVVDREGLVRATFGSDAEPDGMARTLRRVLRSG